MVLVTLVVVMMMMVVNPDDSDDVSDTLRLVCNVSECWWMNIDDGVVTVVSFCDENYGGYAGN